MMPERMSVETERRWIIVGLFGLTLIMLTMAVVNTELWAEDTFKTLLTAVVVTGILNMAGAFYFSASSADAKRVEADAIKAENTGKAFEAIKAAAKQIEGEPTVILEPGETAQAAPTVEVEGEPDVRLPK